MPGDWYRVTGQSELKFYRVLLTNWKSAHISRKHWQLNLREDRQNESNQNRECEEVWLLVSKQCLSLDIFEVMLSSLVMFASECGFITSFIGNTKGKLFTKKWRWTSLRPSACCRASGRLACSPLSLYSKSAKWKLCVCAWWTLAGPVLVQVVGSGHRNDFIIFFPPVFVNSQTGPKIL